MKQEPVAWMYDTYPFINVFSSSPPASYDMGTLKPLFTTPIELMPTIVKDEQGKVVAVTLTNEEHQVQEVLWQAPRELSDEEIKQLIVQHIQTWNSLDSIIDFARAILKKASEK